MPAEPACITLKNLVKSFSGHRAVDGVSFEVPSGTIFGLLGPNGAGKTTTIRMIMDIIRPDSGEISLLGRSSADGVKGQVGYLPEERGLYPKMRVLDMLEFLGAIKGMRLADARRESASWLDRLGLGGWAQKPVEALSKGMQQKVQLAGTVLGRPRLLILDEPFSGLDPMNQDSFKDILLELNRDGATVIFSTHQMDTAEKLCREIGLINQGKVVLQGPLKTLKSQFGSNSVLMEFEGDGSFLRDLPGVSGVDDYGEYQELRLEAGTDPRSLLEASMARLKIRRFEVVVPTLHNIFIEKVGKAPDA
ncbi:ABC transporter ATP-binding protein [Elusimicrobiota bacterium]